MSASVAYVASARFVTLCEFRSRLAVGAVIESRVVVDWRYLPSAVILLRASVSAVAFPRFVTLYEFRSRFHCCYYDSIDTF